MLEIALVRSGSTDFDTNKRIQGALDIPLNEKGKEEAYEAALQLKDRGVDLIYCPESEPACQTSEIIASTLQIRMEKITRLENLSMGLWQGLEIEEVRRKQPRIYKQWLEHPETVCPPQGEMLEEADERLRFALAKLLKRHKKGIISICLPEPLLSLARRYLTNEELGDLWKPDEGHARVEWLTVEPEEVVIARS